MRFHHGTGWDHAQALLDGAPLSAGLAAAAKLDGPPGFFLAEVRSDAEFFAARREPGAIIVVDIDEEAVKVLIGRGAQRRPIPVTPRSPFFGGMEFHIPVELFGLFEQMRAEGRIDVGF